jgi:hypothetical protein
MQHDWQMLHHEIDSLSTTKKQSSQDNFKSAITTPLSPKIFQGKEQEEINSTMTVLALV